jgi:7-cyano-7-deazaguanine synthase in queuosine biosynthesis
MKTINICGVNIDIYNKPGISVSGGADSALLLYILMTNATDTIHIFTTGNNQKFRRNVIVATSLVEKLIQITNNSNVEHHISYEEIQNTKTLYPKLGFYKKTGLVDVIYTGITANPPKHIAATFKFPITENNRDPEVQHNTKLGIFYTPFCNHDKSKIAEIYKKLKITEVFNYTRSCEYHNEMSIQDPGLGHCGECWWCQERIWAFGRL